MLICDVCILTHSFSAAELGGKEREAGQQRAGEVESPLTALEQCLVLAEANEVWLEGAREATSAPTLNSISSPKVIKLINFEHPSDMFLQIAV